MKRFRVDFSIRELDVPDEQAEGIRFGDEVPITKLFEFFDRCRDAVRALYDPELRARAKEQEQKELELQLELQKQRLMMQSQNMLSQKTLRDQYMMMATGSAGPSNFTMGMKPQSPAIHDYLHYDHTPSCEEQRDTADRMRQMLDQAIAKKAGGKI